MYLIPLKINNSASAAIQSGTWKNPGAAFYDKLLNAIYVVGDYIPSSAEEWEQKRKEGKYLDWSDYIKEAYLIAPINNIKNSPYGVTPFSRSGCKYPHHAIKGDQLVLSVPGVKAAYSRLKQMGEYKGAAKEHIDRHIKELGLSPGDNVQENYVIPEDNNPGRVKANFEYIFSFIENQTGVNLSTEDDEPIPADIIDPSMPVEDQITEAFDWIESAAMNGVPDIDAPREKEFVPIYGIVKSYSKSAIRNDGSAKSESELSSVRFHKIIKKLTRGDNYSHALVSFDDSLTSMYSYEDEGFVVDNILTKDSWMGTESIYICVMFVTKEDKDRMQKFVNDLMKHAGQTHYASANLLKAYIGTPYKVDKRFVCSSFTGYILSCANPKNLHRDYSRLRPEDITILPRSFYVMNVKDREDFIRHRDDIRKKVESIYDEYHDEIEDYNNHLPKLMLRDRIDRLKTIDKIFDWIIDRL